MAVVGREILEHAQTGAVLASHEGVIGFANSRFLDEMGLELDAVTGTPYTALLDPADVAEERRLFPALIAGSIDFYVHSVNIAIAGSSHRSCEVAVTALREPDRPPLALAWVKPHREPAPHERPVWLDKGRIVVKEGSRIVVVPSEETLWISADGSYSVVHEGGRDHLVRVPLGTFEEALKGTSFCRIHRSTIVNLRWVREIRLKSRGDAQARLVDGATFRVSRSCREQVQSALGLVPTAP